MKLEEFWLLEKTKTTGSDFWSDPQGRDLHISSEEWEFSGIRDPSITALIGEEATVFEQLAFLKRVRSSPSGSRSCSVSPLIPHRHPVFLIPLLCCCSLCTLFLRSQAGAAGEVPRNLRGQDPDVHRSVWLRRKPCLSFSRYLSSC